MSIEIKGVTKTYPRGPRALKGIDLSIGKGMFGLLGPNGAGKTTLMRILATLLKPTSGTAAVFGLDVQRDRGQIRRILGYLPQEYNLYPSLTAYEFLDYMALLQGIQMDRRRLIQEMLERVGLIQVSNRKVGTFSGGMKQRLGVAQALLNDPALLIVDEPTAGLDPAERVRFRNFLAEISPEKVVILSTHIVADAATTCADMAVLNEGEILFRGSPEELIKRAEGHVWKAVVPLERFAAVKQDYRIVSTVHTAKGLELRVIGPQIEGLAAEPVSPTLEDAYLHLLGETDEQMA